MALITSGCGFEPSGGVATTEDFSRGPDDEGSTETLLVIIGGLGPGGGGGTVTDPKMSVPAGRSDAQR